MKISSVTILLILCMLAACSSPDIGKNNTAYTGARGPVPALGNMEFYTHRLATELFAQTRPANQSRYAVVGFVPLPEQEYQENNHHPLQLLGHQLKEGLITEATKRGYATQEFLLSDDIRVTEQSDSVLTRDVDRIGALRRVDFFITGTVIDQEQGALVNARIVHAQTKEVVAAATSFFPAQLFWQEERVSVRNGRLIRTQTAISNSN